MVAVTDNIVEPDNEKEDSERTIAVPASFLEWTMNVCKQIQSSKTYASRFPETSLIAANIQDLLDYGEIRPL